MVLHDKKITFVLSEKSCEIQKSFQRKKVWNKMFTRNLL